jgi:hypothetical protein
VRYTSTTKLNECWNAWDRFVSDGQSICNLVEDDKNVKDIMVYKIKTRLGAKESIFNFATLRLSHIW